MTVDANNSSASLTPNNGGTAVFTNGSGTVFGGTTAFDPNQLASTIAELKVLGYNIAQPGSTTGTAPAPSALCSKFSTYLSQTGLHQHGATALQLFLLDPTQGNEAIHLPDGATGYYGSETDAAVQAFQVANHC